MSQSRNIRICLENGGTLVRICDFGKGMSAQQIKDNLLTIGNKSDDDSVSDTRGFFRRGARDVTALGDVAFDSFRGSKWSQLIIRNDLSYSMNAEDQSIEEAPEVVRSWHAQSPEQSGTIVSLQMVPVHRVTLSREQCVSSLANLFQLRFAMADQTREIRFQFGENVAELDLVRYVFPKSMRVFEPKRFTVPGYEQFEAVFELFIVDSALARATDFRTAQSGVCVRSANTCYEMTYFDSRLQYDRVSQYFYGFLTTESIHALLVDYDRNGQTVTNPMLIVDPGRGHGLNVDHPFIRALYSIPQVYLRMAIQERSNFQEYASDFEDTDEPSEIKGLELVASRFINTESPRFFRYNSYMNSLALVVADIDKQYITSTLKVHEDIQVRPIATTIESSSSEIALFASTEEIMENNLKTLKQRYGDFVDEELLADSSVSAEKSTPPLSVKVTFEENDAEMNREYRVAYTLSHLTIKINLLHMKVATYYQFAPPTDDADVAPPRVVKKDPVTSLEYLKHLVTDAIAWICLTEKKGSAEQDPVHVMGEFLETKTKVYAAFMSSSKI